MPENIRAYYNLSLLHDKNKDHKKAEKTLIDGLKMDPENESLLYALAYHYATYDKKEKAINILLKLTEFYPENAQYQNFLNNLSTAN